MLIAVFAFRVGAQSKNVSNYIFSADNAMKQKNYYGAAKLYEEALLVEANMYDIVWKAAEAYRLDNDYNNAMRLYKMLVDKQEEKFPEATYYYAQMLKSNEDFMRAQYFFNRYISNMEKPFAKENSRLVELAKTEIINCEYAWKQQNNPQAVEIKHYSEGINSVYSDFGATLNKNKIFFASIQPDTNDTNSYKSRLYYSMEDSLEEKQLFDSIVNLPSGDISNPCFNKAGDVLYFSHTEDFTNGYTYLYKCEKTDTGWNFAERLPEKISPVDCNSTQPHLVEIEGRLPILLWSSDRKGGVGGYDIYSCEIFPDGSFANVKNVGRPIIDDERFAEFIDTTSTINSAGDEITPFYNYYDSTLYFSSNYGKTIGGFDIFGVKGNFLTWQQVENLGYPINTAQNDYYYKIFPENGIAFITSNRKQAFAQTHQSCCNDIFYYNIEQYVNEEEKLRIETELRISTLTTKAKLLVPISLYFHNDIPNPNSWDTTTNYNYSDTYFAYMKMQEKYRHEFGKGLDKTTKQQSIDSIDNYFSNFVEENYNKLIEFTNLTRELLANGRKIVITIKGYTSPLNTVEYNNNLAKRRISSLVNFFDEYDNGYFRQYVANGQIEYKFVAFGKTKANANVSDDRSDQRNSVYNPAAARERRIEIIAVEIGE